MEIDRKPAPDDVSSKAERSTTVRSPKDLVGVIERPAGKGEGFKVEIGPTKSMIKWTLPDMTGDTIRSHITVLKNWATSLLGGDGGGPTLAERPRKKDRRATEAVTSADRAYWAQRVLKKLDDVESDLINVERASDVDTVRRHAFATLEVAPLNGGHWRLFRVFHLYLEARAIPDNMDRLHQYCRCIDGLIVSKRGEAKAQFKSRTELFISTTPFCDKRAISCADCEDMVHAGLGQGRCGGEGARVGRPGSRRGRPS